MQIQDLVERLRHRGTAIARAVRVGVAMFEHLAAVAQRHTVKRETEAEYWHNIGEKVGPVSERAERQKQTKTRGVSR